MIYLEDSNVGELEKEYVTKALDTSIVSTASPLVDEFEQKMAAYLKVPDCIAVNSGTSALHLALMECGVGRGKKVIIPALTFKATYNVVQYVCADVYMLDVDLESWIIDIPEIWGETADAIIPVSLYGNPIPKCLGHSNIIADEAQAFGSISENNDLKYRCYSFNGNKAMTTGGGGLLIGPNLDNIKEKLKPGQYEGVGYNYRMTGLSATLGLAQLKRLPYFLKRKKEINRIYRNELEGFVKFQEATPGSEPSWWYTACLFPEKIDIANFQIKLKELGIPSRRIFKPLANLSNARYIYEHGLCLPSSTLNSEEDIIEVCKMIKEMISNGKRQKADTN